MSRASSACVSKYRMKRTFKLAVFLTALLLSAALRAEDDLAVADEDARFKWWWEREAGGTSAVESATEPAPPVSADASQSYPAVGESVMQVESADTAYAKLVEDNLALRKQLAEVEGRNRRAEEQNLELSSKVSELQEKENRLRDSVVDLKSREVASVEADQKLAAMNNELATARDESAILKQRVDNLTRELEAGKAGTDEKVTQDSDLFRRVQEENATLRQHLLELKDAEQKAAVARDQYASQSGQQENEARRLSDQVESLRQENKTLRDVVDSLQKGASKTGKLEKDVGQIREELDRREELLAQKDRELTELRKQMSDRRSKLAEAEKTAAEVKRAKDAMVFDMAVLYAKAGLYAKAEAEFLGILRKDGPSADLYYNLGILYDAHLGKTGKAQEYYRKYLELVPEGTDAEKVRLWLLELEMRF